MAIISNPGIIIKDCNGKSFENCYGIIDNLTINKYSQECCFYFEIYPSQECRKSGGFRISEIPYRIYGELFDTFFSEGLLKEFGPYKCCYIFLKQLSMNNSYIYENWQDDE